eukprot:scaffold66435_cov16-Tisochrysis_lutea.AAC.1
MQEAASLREELVVLAALHSEREAVLLNEVEASERRTHDARQIAATASEEVSRLSSETKRLKSHLWEANVATAEAEERARRAEATIETTAIISADDDAKIAEAVAEAFATAHAQAARADSFKNAAAAAEAAEREAKNEIACLHTKLANLTTAHAEQVGRLRAEKEAMRSEEERAKQAVTLAEAQVARLDHFGDVIAAAEIAESYARAEAASLREELVSRAA